MAIVIILMMTARVGRGGFFVLLQIEGGQTAIGVGSNSSKLTGESLIRCSLVGLYNVLSGVEYQAVEATRQCLIRLQDKHVEVIWKQGNADTVFRLTLAEYKHLLLRTGSESNRAA